MPWWGARCESLADSLASRPMRRNRGCLFELQLHLRFDQAGSEDETKCGIILEKEWTWIWVDRLPLVRSGKGGTYLLIGSYTQLVVPYSCRIERTEALPRSFPHPTLLLHIDHGNNNNFHRCFSLSRKTSVFPIEGLPSRVIHLLEILAVSPMMMLRLRFSSCSIPCRLEDWTWC